MSEPHGPEPGRKQQIPGIRASDADRARTAGLVQAAMGQGMLTFAEGDQRLAAVYAARFRQSSSR